MQVWVSSAEIQASAVDFRTAICVSTAVNIVLRGTHKFSGVRNGQSTVGGPKWTKMDLFRPKWTILVHFGLANAKAPVRKKVILTKMVVGPFWSSIQNRKTVSNK